MESRARSVIELGGEVMEGRESTAIQKRWNSIWMDSCPLWLFLRRYSPLILCFAHESRKPFFTSLSLFCLFVC